MKTELRVAENVIFSAESWYGHGVLSHHSCVSVCPLCSSLTQMTAQADLEPQRCVRSWRSLCFGCCRTDPAFSLETSEALTPGTQSRLEYITQTHELTPLGIQRPSSYGKCVSRRLQSVPSRKPVNKLALSLGWKPAG